MPFPIYLHNSLSKNKELFVPINEEHVTMYACGPTVYDRAHLGNARAAVVYDLLFRLLQARYQQVTYVRNITDIDDKIITASKQAGCTTAEISDQFSKLYAEDMSAIGCLTPTYTPRATEHLTDMFDIINILLEKEIAYIAEGHVLFAVEKCTHYGCLSRRSTDEMLAGARVEVAPFKKNPMDFVLWKPSEDIGYESPYGYGRPGWHIECSAMSKAFLGDVFDIHGGGADLMFPHHENEIAQSCSASGKQFARYWVHNGFLMVNGEKMSKSLGNFKTVADILYGDHAVDGAAIRLLFLATHYRKPLDFNDKSLLDAQKTLQKIQRFLVAHENNHEVDVIRPAIIMADDVNTPELLAHIHQAINKQDVSFVRGALNILGLDIKMKESKNIPIIVHKLAEQRMLAKQNKKYQLADTLRKQIMSHGYIVNDSKDGYTLEEMLDFK